MSCSHSPRHIVRLRIEREKSHYQKEISLNDLAEYWGYTEKESVFIGKDTVVMQDRPTALLQDMY